MRRRSFTNRAAWPLLTVLALLTSGCENTVTLPTPPEAVQVHDVYYGPLDPKGQTMYLTSLDQAGTVQVMLAGLVQDNPLRSVEFPLDVSIGSFDGIDCTPLDTARLTPRFTAAIQRQMETGTHCVLVKDNVGLPATVGIILRIVSPVFAFTGAAPGTTTFASAITPRGRATRSVEASRAGTISLTLNSLTPSNATVGLALGLPATDGSGCQFAKIVTTRPGSSPQITANVDAGFYCMGIFDVGNFTTNQNFSVTIDNP
jgi:hypothetical protein